MNQDFINWVMAGFGGLIGFLLNSVWQAVKDLQTADKELTNKVAKVEILVAGEYVKKTELEGFLKGLSIQMQRIEDKLSHKADKP